MTGQKAACLRGSGVRLSARSFLSYGRQHLELDSIFWSTGGSLHPHEIFERCQLDLQILSKIDLQRFPNQIRVA